MTHVIILSFTVSISKVSAKFNMLLSAVTNTLDEDVDHLDSEEDSVSFICNPFNMVFMKNCSRRRMLLHL